MLNSEIEKQLNENINFQLWNKDFIITFARAKIYRVLLSGANSRIFSGGGLNVFSLQGGGTQQLLGPENPLKSIDVPGPGGAEPSYPPPSEYASDRCESIKQEWSLESL